MMLHAGLTREQSNALYREAISDNDALALRRLCVEDLFFLLTVAMKRGDINRDWLYARCREVEASPNGHLDLWAREHYKSTIITFGKSIQDLLKDPDNTTIGIFSHTRPIAKGFLGQIMREFETNTFLKALFPDVLYERPQSEAPKWSLDSGLILKRKTNPKEASVEAWGLVDGQPTSKHFSLLVYDDVVTRESVTTADQIKKVTAAWELSLNLGAQGGETRYIGTRYHQNDTYKTMMARGSVSPRIYPATHNGKVDGNAVLMPQEELVKKRRDMGPYTFGTQMLQDPIADKAMGFKTEWLKFYKKKPDLKGWNVYLLVDPAGEKKESSDYTVMTVLGMAPDNNFYLLDMIRDRLNLTQRAEKLFELHRKYKPKRTGYEKYGKDSDIEHIKYVMEDRNYRFGIVTLGGGLKKEDRIRQLVPVFEQGRMWIPEKLSFIDHEARVIDLVQSFIDDEYSAFPVSTHDDMLDCMARILDPTLGAVFPKIEDKAPEEWRPEYVDSGQGWMG